MDRSGFRVTASLLVFFAASEFHLQASLGKEPLTLTNHGRWVTAVDFSPDGKTLASASEDKLVMLWDATTGKLKHTLRGHTDCVTAIAFCPDGKTLVSASSDNTLRIWDVETAREKANIDGRGWGMQSLAYSFDGSTLASVGMDCTIMLSNAESGKLKQTFKGHTSSLQYLAFTPDGKTLVSRCLQGTVKLWSLATGRGETLVEGKSASAEAIALSNDGKLLAIATSKSIEIRDVASRRVIRTLKRNKAPIWCIQFSPDRKLLATGSGGRYSFSFHTKKTIGPTGITTTIEESKSKTVEDYSVKLWEVETGRQLATVKAHTNSVRTLDFSPNGKVLASGGLDKTVKLWDVDELLKARDASD